MLKVALFLFFGLLSLNERAQAQALIDAHSIQPCTFWKFDVSSAGYLCVINPRTILVPDAQSTALALQNLQQKIEALEARVKELEGAR